MESMNKTDKIWLELMRIGRVSGCHQMESRSFFLAGCQFPLCARCTGIFAGYIIGVLAFIRRFRIAVPVLFMMCIPCAVDGLRQEWSEYESDNVKRFFTGALLGVSYIQLLPRLAAFVFHYLL